MRRSRAFVPVLILTCALSASAQTPPSRLVLPADDLPYALVDGYRVDFTRSGALVVSRDGHYLFDVGLVYSRPEWKEWGTQIRRASADDTWRRAPEDDGTLVTHGTLFDIKGNPRFSFVQRTTVVTGGMRVSYEVTPLARHVISTCGVTLHFPVPQTRDGESSFWPGFGSVVPLPAELDGWDVHKEQARGATVSVGGSPLVSVVGNEELDWQIRDYRQWRVNAYWLVGADEWLARALSRGQKGSLSLDVRFGPAICRRVAAGAADWEVDAHGRAAAYVAGKKVAEGGLAWDGPDVKWLHENTSPAETPPWHCLATDASGKTMSFGVELAAGQLYSASLRYTMPETGSTPSSRNVQFALAVPVSETTGEPAALAPAPPAAGQTVYGLTVALRDGPPLTLQAHSPWVISRSFAAGAESYLLCIPTSPETDGSSTVWVGMQSVPLPTEDERKATE